jgi:hypothetical protein
LTSQQASCIGGILERLVQVDIVVADLTTINPNVFYELGIRHALRPKGTIVIGASEDPAPFDLALARMVRYHSVDGVLTPQGARDFRDRLASAIREGLAGDAANDSPVFQLLGDPIPMLAGVADRRPLVLQSYARENEGDAIKLYEVLASRNFDAWIDQRSITPGEKWDLAIDTAIRMADFILILLSRQSVSKRGYLRKEIILSLERAKEMLETDIFVIPVRLDECEVPRELAQHQWVDLYSDNGLEQLVRAIREGMKRRSG